MCGASAASGTELLIASAAHNLFLGMTLLPHLMRQRPSRWKRKRRRHRQLLLVALLVIGLVLGYLCW